MKDQTKYFAECLFKDGMNWLEAQIKRNLAGVGFNV